MINRTFDDKEMRLVEFLDQIQEKIYKNMIAIDPSSFKVFALIKILGNGSKALPSFVFLVCSVGA